MIVLFTGFGLEGPYAGQMKPATPRGNLMPGDRREAAFGSPGKVIRKCARICDDALSSGGVLALDLESIPAETRTRRCPKAEPDPPGRQPQWGSCTLGISP